MISTNADGFGRPVARMICYAFIPAAFVAFLGCARAPLGSLSSADADGAVRSDSRQSSDRLPPDAQSEAGPDLRSPTPATDASSDRGLDAGGGPTSSGIEILTRTVASAESSIYFDLQLTNSGSAPLDLSLFTMKYWFTWDRADPTVMPALEGSCSYMLAVGGGSCGAVSEYFEEVTPPRTEADYVFVMEFSSGAGTLGVGATTEIGPGINKSDLSMFDQTNDWSYSSSTSFAPNLHVTAYENYQLVYGVEPP
jgi:hypothetical protein